MILHKLHGGREIRLVELIWDVPTDGSKLPPLLHGGVEESHTVQHGLPLCHVADVQLVL